MKFNYKKYLKSFKSKIFTEDSIEDKRKKQSLKEHAQDMGFSGSAYNAKGNAGHDKIKSNKKRR